MGRITAALLATLAIGTACRKNVNLENSAPPAVNFVSPWAEQPQDVLQDGTTAEAANLLEHRVLQHETLWASGIVEVRERGIKGKRWFQATILYRSPDAIRLRGSRVPIGTLFEIIARGDLAWVHLNRESELYEGTFQELREQGGLAGAVSLREMMAAILVNQELLDRLKKGGMKAVETEDEVLFFMNLSAGRTATWRLRRRDGLVSETSIRDGRGRQELRVVYGGYQLQGGREAFPTTMTIDVQEGAATVTVELDEYKIDPKLQDAVFEPPKAQTVRPLSDLLGRAPIIPLDEEVPRAE